MAYDCRMAENVVESAQRLIQDVIAPDVRDLKTRVGELEKRMDERFDGVSQRFDSLEKSIDQRFDSMKEQIDSNLKIVLSAIGELKAQGELNTLRAVVDLRERVAVLEAQRH